MAETSRKQASARDGSVLSTTEKAAALLLSMDKPLANRIIKHFDDAEVKMFAEAAARLGSLPQQEIEDLVEEFTEAFAVGSNLQGSPQAAVRLLDGIIPPDILNNLMLELAGNSSSRVWTLMPSVAETAISQYLQRQHPQIVTYIVSKMSGSTAAAVLDQLGVSNRVETMRRMLSLKEITPLAQRILERNLQTEVISKAARNSSTDVHARIAAVLNKMSREAADAAFNGLNASRPKDAEKIKGLLFTFDDIAKLSDASRTKLFEGVQAEQIIAALHGTDPELQQMILSVVSQRSRRMIENELQNGRQPSSSEVGKAQRAVADRALELLDRGIIEHWSDG